MEAKRLKFNPRRLEIARNRHANCQIVKIDNDDKDEYCIQRYCILDFFDFGFNKAVVVDNISVKRYLMGYQNYVLTNAYKFEVMDKEASQKIYDEMLQEHDICLY